MISTFKAVFSGFFGVRGRAALEADAKSLKPGAVIAAGVAGAAVLVLAILGLVSLVTR